MVITPAITIPKTDPPNTFPTKIVKREMGANISRSKAPIRFSKVITIASIEVVPKRAAIAIKPGDSSTKPAGFRNVNARLNTKGKRIPQLMLGGLK